MHPTAMSNGKLFFETYAAKLPQGVAIDIGAQDVNGSLRSVCPPHLQFIGVDFVQGRGVDVVLDDPYRLPFEDASIDVVVSSSCFEHSELFWVLFLEIMRVLKTPGLFYLNAPSNGTFHRYPVDCWRFYPDSGKALITWAQRNGVDACVLESYVSRQHGAVWSDFVAVFLKGSGHAGQFPDRITQVFKDFYNGQVLGEPGFMNLEEYPEDLQKLLAHPAASENQQS
ncbi:MAG: class I SAM-dependent methyltransferase [Burkholderiaceae bacterium]|jgi:SAM-dependent methyltransferase|nr:class I SAM-dependent methyltransferase [Burkholderiaceae bacterium]